MKLKNYEQDSTIKLLVLAAEKKTASNGKEYLVMELTDGETQISANKWNYTKPVPDYPKVISCNLKIGTYNNQPSYTIEEFKFEPDEMINEFVKKPPVPIEKMYEEILKTIDTIKNNDIKKLVSEIYNDNKEQIAVWGAAKSFHHNCFGGLLYHVYRMMKSAIAMSEIYSTANRDLLIAGVLLHDIGKLKELDTDKLGTSTYTTDGSLFGHLYLGAEMINDYGKKLNINENILREIKHIVISHHGQMDWGAIQNPTTLEAEIVFILDLADSKIYQFEQASKELKPGEIDTKRTYGLNNVNVYRSSLI